MGAFVAPLKAILYLFALYVVAVHINILVHLATNDDIAPTKDDIKFGVDKEAEAAAAAAAASEGELVPPPAVAKSDPPSHTTTTKLSSPTLNSPEAQQAVASISPDGSQTIQTLPPTKKPKKKRRRTKKIKKVIKPPPIIEKKVVTVIKKEKQRMVLTKDELKELRNQMVPLTTSKAQQIVNKVQDMMSKHTEAKSLAAEVTLPTFRRQHEEFFQHFHKKEQPPQDTELELMERHYDNMLDITKALSLQSFSNLMEEELVTIFGDAINRLDGMIEKTMNDELLDDDLNTMFGVTGKMIDDTNCEEERSVLSFPPVCDVSFLIPPEVDHRVDDTDKDEDGAAEVIEEKEEEVVKEVKEVIPPDVARESDLNNAVGAIERTIRHRLDSLSDVTSPLSSKGTENVRFLLKDRATAIWKERMAEEKAEREALLKEKKAREMEMMKNMDCCVDVEEVNLLVEEGIDALFRKKDLVETLTSLVQMLEEEMGGGKYTDDDDDDDAREKGGMLDVPLIPLDDGGAHDASGSDTNKNMTVRQLIDTALLHKSADGIDYIVENLGGYIDLLDMAIDQIAGDGGDGDSSVGKASIAALMDVLDRVQIPKELRSVYVEARGKAGILWNQV